MDSETFERVRAGVRADVAAIMAGEPLPPLGGVWHENWAEPTLKEVLAAVGAFYDIEPRKLIQHDRAPFLVEARQLAMLLARDCTDKSLPQIGRMFRRDHSTILHGIRCMRQKLRGNPDMQAVYKNLYDRLVTA